MIGHFNLLKPLFYKNSENEYFKLTLKDDLCEKEWDKILDVLSETGFKIVEEKEFISCTKKLMKVIVEEDDSKKDIGILEF